MLVHRILHIVFVYVISSFVNELIMFDVIYQPWKTTNYKTRLNVQNVIFPMKIHQLKCNYGYCELWRTVSLESLYFMLVRYLLYVSYRNYYRSINIVVAYLSQFSGMFSCGTFVMLYPDYYNSDHWVLYGFLIIWACTLGV
jgi:hypothetical protein